MKHKRIVALLLALTLGFTLALPGLAAEGTADPALLTRGELVTALYKLSGDAQGEPRQTYFTDVPADGALAQVVRWAVDNGIIKGYGDGRFGPDDPVTREQMAAILYRNAQLLGQGFQGMWMFLLDYPDAGEISGWADEAMHWVVMKGIIHGTDRGLEPKATATDDQLSLVLQRWQKSVIQAEDGKVWFSFDDAAIALLLPEDMEFQTYNGGKAYIAKNDTISVTLSLLDRVCEYDIQALAALAEETLGFPGEIIHQGGIDLVQSTWLDDSVDLACFAPNGDVYMISAAPNTVDHPELTPADVAEETKAIRDSVCHILQLPEGVKAVELLQTQRPAIDYMVLVNKVNALPEDWEEKLDTVFTVNSVGQEVEAERSAYKAYLALKADLLENDGIELELDSGRRSVAEQQDIMDRFIEKYGAAYAAKTVAQPGYSEHHTGLALDLYFRLDGKDVYYNEDMVKYPEVWEKIHAKLADYGFILRYLEGKEHITGYGYEPWHLRYVGTAEDAHAIMDQPGTTLEVFLGACGDPEVTVDYGTSALYTQEELDAAIVQVKCKFASWAGCELHSLRYGGDAANDPANLEWLNSLEGGGKYTQAMAFLMDFHSPKEAYGAWEADEEYRDYQWWLARKEDGGWDVVTWGYGGPIDPQEEDGQNPVMNFVGNYVCERASALVECQGTDGAKVTIQWGSSAWSLGRWVFSGTLDLDTLTVNYTDCVMTEVEYGDDGQETEKTVYENGTGFLKFGENGTFTWHEDGADRDGDLVFEWAPVAADEA